MNCLICFKDVSYKTSLYAYLFKEDCICGACRKEMQVLLHTYAFTFPITILYVYTKELESLLFQYKEARDIALKDIFLYPYISYIEKRYKDYTLVYMPSSKDKIKERTFSSLACMFEHIHLPKIDIFEKTQNFKQSKQKHRDKIKHYIKLKDNVSIPKTKLLLIDDVVTSGNTLLSAYDLIKDHPYTIEAFVVSGHPIFLGKMEKNLVK